MTRLVSQVANEAYDDFRRILNNCALHKEHAPRYIIHSMPYLREMRNMNKVTDAVGLEDGVMVVLYFLNNTQNWRGDTARRIKAELNSMLKEANK